jgi:hypothetical protein
MSKRDIIKPHGKSVYAVRDKSGKFVDITNIGKSIAEDARTKSKKTVKPGHGHEGDLKRK